MNISEKTGDFPDWWGPMLVKELRQGMKARGFILMFVALHAAFALAMIFAALEYRRNPASFDGDWLNAVLWMIVGVQLLAFTPLRALNEIASEKKANTIELLFMSGLTPWRIVYGKWASLMFQNVLVSLAILPYAILRYYFGRVDIIADLQIIALEMLGSALLTAVALMLSSLHLVLRLVILVLIPFIVSTGAGAVAFAGSSYFGTFTAGSSFAYWCVPLFNCAVIILAMLVVAASAIAPPAENHALRLRLCALALWVPGLVLSFIGSPGVATTQYLFAAFAGFLVALVHLSSPAKLLKHHVKGFKKAKAVGAFTGAFLQPGWPGAVLFLSLVEGLLVWVVLSNTSFMGSISDVLTAGVFTLGSTLLFVPLLTSFLSKSAKQPLVRQALILLLFFIIALVLLASKPATFHFGLHPIFSLIPPISLLLMNSDWDDPARTHLQSSWLIWSTAVFGVIVVLSILRARPFWQSYFSEFRRPQVPAPLD